MQIGIPKEIKNHEYRVGATPGCVAAYVADGHQLLVEKGAGVGSGFDDRQYLAAGAQLAEDGPSVWSAADMIVKVKEPLPSEYDRMREGQLLYTYLHLAAAPELADAMVERGVTGVAYETIQLLDGSLPCLTPMSAIAGRLAVQEGAKYLEKPFGGRGVLLGGVPGVKRGKVCIIGAGIVGTNAAQMAMGLGAQVTVLDVSQGRMMELEDQYGVKLQTLYSNEANLGECLAEADLVIGAVLLPGAAAPKLIRREHLSTMQPGAVIVDVAVDQGGCAETTKATTHDAPIYTVDGIVHYCVANMPAAVSRTSTLALTSTTLGYGRLLAGQGLARALVSRPELKLGLNVHDGAITHPAVAESLGKPCRPLAA